MWVLQASCLQLDPCDGMASKYSTADQWFELDLRDVYIGKKNSTLKQNTL